MKSADARGKPINVGNKSVIAVNEKP